MGAAVLGGFAYGLWGEGVPLSMHMYAYVHIWVPLHMYIYGSSCICSHTGPAVYVHVWVPLHMFIHGSRSICTYVGPAVYVHMSDSGDLEAGVWEYVAAAVLGEVVYGLGGGAGSRCICTYMGMYIYASRFICAYMVSAVYVHIWVQLCMYICLTRGIRKQGGGRTWVRLSSGGSRTWVPLYMHMYGYVHIWDPLYMQMFISIFLYGSRCICDCILVCTFTGPTVYVHVWVCTFV